MRRLVTLVVLLVATLPAPASGASVPVLVVDGRGFGHGVGMAQDGAYWMGVEGARTEQILGHFYPGTSIGRGQGDVRVVIADVGIAPTSLVMAFPRGGELRDAPSGAQSPGFPVPVGAGEHVRIAWDGRVYRVERVAPHSQAQRSPATVTLGRPSLASSHRPAQILDPPTTTTEPSTTTTTERELLPSTTTVPPSTTTTSPPDEAPTTSSTTTSAPAPPAGAPTSTSTRSLWAVPAAGGTVDLPGRQRTYRGLVEATAAATGTLRAVNRVDVETYLKGMGEVRDPRWPPAALRAQAIAARTYALRAMLVGGGEICDTQRCQVYLGAQAEYGAMNKAVDDTRGQVVVYHRQLASAVYSANGGGHSASREEGFGIPGEDGSAPYLRPAPYVTKDAAPWSVTIALDVVAKRLGYAGTITSVTPVKTGPSGRVLEVTLDGSAGPKAVQGIAFDAALGLRSTLFTTRIGAADVAPPPPPLEEPLIQALPEQAAAVTASGPAAVATSVPPRPATPPPANEDQRRYLAIILATWAVVAAAGAGAVTLYKPKP